MAVRGAHRREPGFTLVEVVIAAAVLTVFAVFALEPLQRNTQAVTRMADRSAAVEYALAGFEWARGNAASGSWSPAYSFYERSDVDVLGRLVGNFNYGDADPSYIDGYTKCYRFVDSSRGVTFERTVFKTPVTVTLNGTTVTTGYNLRSRVRWFKGSSAQASASFRPTQEVILKTFVARPLAGQ